MCYYCGYEMRLWDSTLTQTGVCVCVRVVLAGTEGFLEHVITEVIWKHE